MAYSSVDAFLADLGPGKRRDFEEALRIVRRLVPRAELGIKYGTPFFTLNGLFLYFSHHPKNGSWIGFCQGESLSDEAGILSGQETRKQVRHWHISEDHRLDTDLFGAYVMEAAAIQEIQGSFRRKA